MIFETYRDHDGGCRWRLKGRGGRVVAASFEGFHDQRSALDNARLTARALTLCLAEFDAVPRHVDDQSTTEPIDTTKE